jgi:hypothetical protein
MGVDVLNELDDLAAVPARAIDNDRLNPIAINITHSVAPLPRIRKRYAPLFDVSQRLQFIWRAILTWLRRHQPALSV